MNGTNRLVADYSRQHHPLARGFDQEEALAFVESLRARLQSSVTELDCSPTSLKRMEQRLAQLSETLEAQNDRFTEEEVFQLIHEVAAYVGLVMVTHVGGKWHNLGTLWGTEIEIVGPIKVIKGGTSYSTPHAMTLSLGNIAADAWDLVLHKQQPNLYQLYRNAKAKVAKQQLRRRV